MKKVIFTLTLALVTLFSASAQEKMWVGGTVGLWTSKEKGMNREVSFKVMPEFGFILNENLAVGVSIGGAHAHKNYIRNIDGDFDGALNIYTIAPFLRYTFLKGNIGALFVDGGVGYAHIKEVAGGVKADQFQVGFRPGVALNVSNNLALIGKFGFLGYNYLKGENSYHSDSFGLDFDLSNVEIGVNLKF